jgi:hypothetical protein
MSAPISPNDTQDRPADLLLKLQSDALHRFELELDDLRTTMAAMAACCEQSLTRLRDARWVPFEAASQLVDEVAAEAERERSAASELAEELAEARRELERVKDECRVEIESVYEAAAREREDAARQREEAAAACERELEEARAFAQLAIESESKVRSELNAVRARNQDIIDAQMLRLMEFKRDLEQSSTTVMRPVPVGEAAAPQRSLPQPAIESFEPETQPAPQVVPERPRLEVIPPLESTRHRHAPEFDAIEAVLASTQPVDAWERTA